MDFYSMQHSPDQAKDEDFSVTVLIFDETGEFFDLGYYSFEDSEWVILGDMSFKMICWCYVPDPAAFLKGKNLKPELHRGYC